MVVKKLCEKIRLNNKVVMELFLKKTKIYTGIFSMPIRR
jgi:hypothetical protein